MIKMQKTHNLILSNIFGITLKSLSFEDNYRLYIKEHIFINTLIKLIPSYHIPPYIRRLAYLHTRHKVKLVVVQASVIIGKVTKKGNCR